MFYIGAVLLAGGGEISLVVEGVCVIRILFYVLIATVHANLLLMASTHHVGKLLNAMQRF